MESKSQNLQHIDGQYHQQQPQHEVQANYCIRYPPPSCIEEASRHPSHQGSLKLSDTGIITNIVVMLHATIDLLLSWQAFPTLYTLVYIL